MSDATAQAIDKEVRGLVDDAHENALKILRHNLPLLESIAQESYNRRHGKFHDSCPPEKRFVPPPKPVTDALAGPTIV